MIEFSSPECNTQSLSPTEITPVVGKLQVMEGWGKPSAGHLKDTLAPSGRLRICDPEDRISGEAGVTEEV